MWTVRKIIKASIIIYSLVFFITVAKQLCLKQFQNRPTSSNVKVREKNASNEDESGYFPESQIISTKVVAAVSADQVKNAPSNKLPLKTRYLLPVIHSGGQNVQFLAFKRATTFAYVHNRTIVATPFFLHGGDARGWTMEHWRDFNITFDTDVLQEIVPVATLEDFKAQCTGKIKALHVTLHGITKTAHILNNILKLGPISSENLRRISSSYDEDPLGDETCVAFLLPHDLQDPDREMTELIDSHFVRSPVIQRAVDAVCKHACNGGRLLAIHWRNRTGEPCVHFLHYPEVKAKCAKDLPFAVRAAHVVGHSLKLYMDAENYNCLFVAHPNYSMSVMDYFKTEIPEARLVHSDIVRTLNVPETNRIKDDLYLMSLFDQEMCFRADLFLRPYFSSWSDFIEHQRTILRQRTMQIGRIPGLETKEFRKYGRRFI